MCTPQGPLVSLAHVTKARPRLTFLPPLPLLPAQPSPSLQTQLVPAQPVKSPAPGSLMSGATCLVSCVTARSWFCSRTEPIHSAWLLPMKNQRHCPSQRQQPS